MVCVGRGLKLPEIKCKLCFSNAWISFRVPVWKSNTWFAFPTVEYENAAFQTRKAAYWRGRNFAGSANTCKAVFAPPGEAIAWCRHRIAHTRPIPGASSEGLSVQVGARHADVTKVAICTSVVWITIKCASHYITWMSSAIITHLCALHRSCVSVACSHLGIFVNVSYMCFASASSADILCLFLNSETVWSILQHLHSCPLLLAILLQNSPIFSAS